MDMTYTSGKISHDPHPYVWEGHSPFDQMRADTDRFRAGAPRTFPRYHYRPRPEFDNHNPILVSFRRMQELCPNQSINSRSWGYLSALRNLGLALDATPEQVEHARRVLTMLAKLS